MPRLVGKGGVRLRNRGTDDWVADKDWSNWHDAPWLSVSSGTKRRTNPRREVTADSRHWLRGYVLAELRSG
jgi:hypothetical protein